MRNSGPRALSPIKSGLLQENGGFALLHYVLLLCTCVPMFICEPLSVFCMKLTLRRELGAGMSTRLSSSLLLATFCSASCSAFVDSAVTNHVLQFAVQVHGLRFLCLSNWVLGCT